MHWSQPLSHSLRGRGLICSKVLLDEVVSVLRLD